MLSFRRFYPSNNNIGCPYWCLLGRLSQLSSIYNGRGGVSNLSKRIWWMHGNRVMNELVDRKIVCYISGYIDFPLKDIYHDSDSLGK